eukprot:SAG22_NODE_15042_length_358_cov_1.594595_1_plen_70_part_01
MEAVILQALGWELGQATQLTPLHFADHLLAAGCLVPGGDADGPWGARLELLAPKLRQFTEVRHCLSAGLP